MLRVLSKGRACVFGMALMMACPCLHGAEGQQAAGKPLKLTFAAASVKPRTGPGVVGATVQPGGRVLLQGFSLKTLVSIAYDVPFGQITAQEGWMHASAYDIEAVPPEELRGNISLSYSLFHIGDPKLREMLRSLLEERFDLTVREETSEGPVLWMERSGRPLLLRPAKLQQTGDRKQTPGEASSIGWAEGWGIFNATMPQLAQFASEFYEHMPVEDRTGLTGSYDYRGPEEHTAGEKMGSFDLMIEEVGLKFVRARGPVRKISIETATPPQAN